jgi:replicative superfamily II helicase
MKLGFRSKFFSFKLIIIFTNCSFYSNCKRIAKAGSPFSAGEIYENIVNLLKKNSPNIQEDILNLLGFEEFDFIEKVLSSRENILKSIQGKNKPIQPPASAIKIKTVEKLGKHYASEWEIQVDEFDSVDPQNLLKQQSNQTPEFPHVYGGKRELNFGSKLSLPIGTERKDMHTYEEFVIPHVSNSKTKKPQLDLVKISQMENFARLSFPGYSNLNLMQSIVYETISFTNENVLVSAPTGSGKTDIAVLSILKAIRDNLLTDPNSSGKPIVALDAFKIVYVAPMKALATEIVGKLSKRLAPLGIKVREYTGDMQLTRHEIQETQIIVSTPEKWDVITRKPQGDLDLVKLVTLLIIDEVHLLHDSRGPVLESIVARTLREVEISQRMIRIVGLSATLPNYLDVALFLRVNPYKGMFFFDDSFRPIPLTQQFIGVKGKKHGAVAADMNQICFDKMANFVRGSHQVMIFVHSRNDTTKTAKNMINLAVENQVTKLFIPEKPSREYEKVRCEVQKSRNHDVKELFSKGFGIHHAGMIRSDRLLVEKLFMEGHIQVLVCTATLAWGVNLPAHAVIIKGTQVYDSEKGEFTNLSILDVLQIFGRAGRPQFESHGEGIILTTHDKLFHYLNAIMCQTPIESQFIKMLPDNLNAEIALGTVSNIQEAVAWLGYTYLSVRMKRNPLAYGITPKDITLDPSLHAKSISIITDVATKLRNCGMINFDNPEKEGFMRVRNVGRLASLFYLKYETIEHFGRCMNPQMTEEQLLAMICECSEFETIKIREEEMDELEALADEAVLTVKGDLTSSGSKVSLLLQAYISRYDPVSFSLQSDLNTIKQNAGRVFRAVFEIVRSQEWASCSLRALKLCLYFERRVWAIEHPLAQFDAIPRQVSKVLYDKGFKDVQRLLEEFDPIELARISGQGSKIVPILRRCIHQFPRIKLDVSCQPVLPSVLSLKLKFCVDFSWDSRVHGSDSWWIWVEDETNVFMKYCEMVQSGQKQVGITRELEFYIAIDPKNPPAQLYVRAVSNRWLHAQELISLPLRFYSSLFLNDGNEMSSKGHTDLLPTHPLPISALQDSALESLYAKKFEYFNSVQSQTFHSLYHENKSVLIGAPTGSGKTTLAELAMWQALRTNPDKKIVYIAPLKALVKERLEDWKDRLKSVLGISVVELTGDTTPESWILQKSNLILTTPEKWDGISRNWKTRKFVSEVSLVILDEIHLLGSDRGHVLEMIVTRMRKLSGQSVRLVGLSTAMANASDLTEWLNNCGREGSSNSIEVFNFRPSVRPVPLQVYLEGYADLHYCPRMASMNKPIYTHILTLSPDRPCLIFVSSRRQTRLTAQALISLCVNDDQPHRFLFPGKTEIAERLELEDRLNSLLEGAIDPIFKHCLSFGIGMHHAGMPESDRKIAEEAFSLQLVQVLIATSTVAWGVNFPAHLVIVKGTEFFDAKIHGYRDLPVTDILQMIGRAGRPQFDTSAKAVILAQDTKKYFYKKFLYEPFPIESSLHLNLTDHLNSEIATGLVKDKKSALEFLKSTYLGIRLRRNPLYYGAEGKDSELIDKYLIKMIENSIGELSLSGCIKFSIDGEKFETSLIGKIGSKYYLSHKTLRFFIELLDPSSSSSVNQIIRAVAFASEFDNFPLRHNEDVEISEFVGRNREIIKDSFLSFDYSEPNSKVYVLLRAFLLRIRFPVIDFETDFKIIKENSKRILAGLSELASKQFWLQIYLDTLKVSQLIKQRISSDFEGSCLLQLPNISKEKCSACPFKTLKDLILTTTTAEGEESLKKVFKSLKFGKKEIEEIFEFLKFEIPKISISNFEIERKSIFTFSLKFKVKPEKDEIFVFIGNLKNLTLLTEPLKVKNEKFIELKFEIDEKSELKDLNLFLIHENFYGLDKQIPLSL